MTTSQSIAASAAESLSVLITSVSKKVPMASAVRAAATIHCPAARVYGADTNAECVGRHFVDGFWVTPRDEHLVVDDVINWCRVNDVSIVFPSRDGELAFWARHRARLSSCGISVMVSDLEAVDACLDKLAFYQHCAGLGFPAIYTHQQCDRIADSTLVVKERYGSGSDSIGIGLDHSQALKHSQSLTSPVFQPWISGDEVSADLYVSCSGTVKGVVLRRRNTVVNGESQVTTTFHDRSLQALCTEIADSLGLRGHIMFQIIVDRFGTPHIVECNCRFGGASTLSIESGLNSFYWFLLESTGVDLDTESVNLASDPLCQIRYAMDKVVPA